MMTITISCDGCDKEETVTTDIAGASSDIESQLDGKWLHESSEDFCPECKSIDRPDDEEGGS